MNDASTVSNQGTPSASAQDVAEHDLIEWGGVWLRLGDKPSAPWRSETVACWELPQLIGSEVMKAAPTFSIVTSVGCDSISPKSAAWLCTGVERSHRDLLQLC